MRGRTPGQHEITLGQGAGQARAWCAGALKRKRAVKVSGGLHMFQKGVSKQHEFTPGQGAEQARAWCAEAPKRKGAVKVSGDT